MTTTDRPTGWDEQQLRDLLDQEAPPPPRLRDQLRTYRLPLGISAASAPVLVVLATFGPGEVLASWTALTGLAVSRTAWIAAGHPDRRQMAETAETKLVATALALRARRTPRARKQERGIVVSTPRPQR
ncbi:hypothetical protein ACWDUL_20915 [Nocardia niigatensis]